jgi:type VI protein secretion system component VasF
MAQAADSVLDACEPIFSTLLDLRPEGAAPDTRTLYGSLAGHLATFRGRAGAAGLTDPEADAVTFALAAFADETVMRSDWGGRGQWPLLEYATFGTHHAGEEFYRILAPGGASPNGHDPAAWAAAWPGAGGAAVVEVYACCLLFGFRGRHAVSAPDEYQRELARVLARVRSRPAPPLSPRPLSRPFGAVAGATGDGRPWALAGTLLLLCFLAVVVVVATVAGG